ncbi:MAG: hypothetical protein AAF307_12490 [Pseudomonadota bacterium]
MTMSVIDHAAETAQKLPTVRSSDWFIRVPLAAIALSYGMDKTVDIADQAASNGLPLILFALATFAEIAGGLALLLGGIYRNNWFSDLVTRLGGLAVAIVTLGVIVTIYYGPFYGWHLQGMLLAASLFFVFRGNGDVKGRALI